MKPFLLVMACVFLPMQTVYYMDCCCGDFCTHKNACTGCEEDQTKPCEMHPNHQPGGDCCNSGAKPVAPMQEHHKRACSHVSPSSEVSVQPVDGVPIALAADCFWVIMPIIPEPEMVEAADYLIEKVPRPAIDVSRHLLLSVLQV